MKNGFAVLILFLWVASATAAGPNLAVHQKEYRFGEIFAGEKVEHLFTLRNDGDEPLVIEKVRSSCGCTAALLSSHRIPPGEEAELQAVFDSKRFQGPVVKTIYVYSNDPLQRVFQLNIRGTVVPEIEVKPSRVDFGSLSPGQAAEATVLLLNRSPNDIVFSAVTATVPQIEAELKNPELASGEQTELLITARPEPDSDRLSGYVLLETDSDSESRLRIAVIGSVSRSEKTARNR